MGKPVFDPYIIKSFDGVKVAFVGVTTPDTLKSSAPKYFQDDKGNFIYDFCQDNTGENLYNAIQKAVDDARSDGAQYVIIMGHVGKDRKYTTWNYADIIANTTGIDAFLNGHGHDIEKATVKNKDGKDVIRQACVKKMNGIGWLRIGASDGNLDTGLYYWNNDVSAPELFGINNELNEAIKRETANVNEKLGEVVAHSSVDLTINDPVAVNKRGNHIRIIRQAETNLGDLCADACLSQLDTDIGIVNSGGVKTNINNGDITMNDIFKVHPFGTMMSVIEATGQQILDALE